MARVTIQRIQGRQLVGSARQHAMVFDQPAEAGGTDLGPSASELFLFSLGSCMSFIMLQYAQLKGMKIDGLKLELADEVAKSPERISRVTARIQISGDLTDEEITRLLRSARSCKIHNTISAHPEVEVFIEKT